MNCVQALAVAAAALATSGLPIEAQIAEARCFILDTQTRSHAMMDAASEAVADHFQQAHTAPESETARVGFAYAPDGWIHGAMRHPL